MRAARTLAVTATAFAAVALAAPLSVATSGPSDVSVNPYDVHAGSTLTITAKGCGHGGTVTSNAFPETNLSVNSNGLSSAIARVYNHATPGNYNLAVRCSDNRRVVTAPFRVLAGRGAQGGLGGSLAPSSTEMAVGGSLVAAAALGGGVFVLRRRRMTGTGA
ncbi:hypothetical protein ACF1BN_27640 [Streptomyces sp. NPDC014861]|uniref:hypothetical protein n=1 Tax=Streptomyces sp. NPDC014861 TaxID=3364923 RepID=UPI0036FAE614